MSLKTSTLMTSDKMLGVVGGGMALASASFGIYMNVHGPAPGSLGNSHDFTVFAQLAPRGGTATTASRDRAKPGAAEDLDMTATASIPGHSRGPRSAPDEADTSRSDHAIDPAVTLESAEGDTATVAVAGQLRVVHVGDTIPGAGQVLAILPGPRPTLKTSQGLIVSSR